MRCSRCSVIEWIASHGSSDHASRLNAVESMQRGHMHPHWMQMILCSMAHIIPIECSGFHAAWLNEVDSMQHEEMEPYGMQGILCRMIECSGFLQHDWMKWIFCSMATNIPIEWSRDRAAWLNAVDFMNHGQKHPDTMQRIPCSVIECSGFHASLLNAVDSTETGKMHPYWMQ